MPDSDGVGAQPGGMRGSINHVLSRIGGNSLVLGSILTFGVRIYGALLQYLTHIYLARTIGAEELGIYVFAWTSVSILAFLTPLGFDTSIVRFVAEDAAREEWGRVRGILRLAHRLTMRTAWITGILALGLAWILDPGLGSPYTIPTMVALGLLPVLSLVNLYQGIARGFHWIAQVAGPGYVLRPTLFLLFAFLAVRYLEPTGTHMVYAIIGAVVLTLCVQRVGYRRSLPEPARTAAPELDEKLWLRTSLPMMLVASFELMVANTDIVMMGLIRGPAETGVYNIAVRTSSCLLFVFFAVTSFAAPRIAALYASGDRPALIHFAAQARLWVLLPTVLGAIALFFGGQTLLGLFGMEFDSAYLPTLILTVGILVRATAGPADSLLTMTGKERQLAKALGIATVINLIGNGLLIPRFGGIGAATATALSVTAEVLMISVLAGRHIGIHPFLLTPAIPREKKR